MCAHLFDLILLLVIVHFVVGQEYIKSLRINFQVSVAIEDLDDGETIKNAKVRRSKRRETK